MNKDKIREQFGANAANYVTSKPHAKGASLGRLAELIVTEPSWEILDIATAAGHTAFVFAPQVNHVWATDITPEMLILAEEQARQRGLDNVTVEYADAEALPYGDDRFDLVTCRIAAHHFSDVGPFVGEAARVLKSGGILAVVDNIVPSGPAGEYINALEKLRDPSHVRCLSLDEWQAALNIAGFRVQHVEVIEKAMSFEHWAARHDDLTQRYLRAMLSEVTGEAADFLHPTAEESGLLFHLQEGIFVGRLEPTRERR